MSCILENSIEALAKCFSAPDKLVKSRLDNDLSFDTAMTVVVNAIENKEITSEEILEIIRGENCLQ